MGRTRYQPQDRQSPDVDTLYGVDDTGTLFRTMSVNAAGVTVTNTSKMPVGSNIKFSSGMIYSGGGAVIQGSTNTLAGMIQVQTLFNSFVPDSTLNLVFFMSSGVINVFNRLNYTFVGTLTVPPGGLFTDSSLVRWGNDGLAFRTDTQVFLIRIPSGWAAPSGRRPGQITSQ